MRAFLQQRGERFEAIKNRTSFLMRLAIYTENN